MKAPLLWCSLVGTFLLFGWAPVTAADQGGDPERPGAGTLGSDAKKVMCSYLAYGAPRHICGEGDLSRLKKQCEEKATKELGKKSECTCTDDPGYIQNYCD